MQVYTTYDPKYKGKILKIDIGIFVILVDISLY